MEPVVLTFSRYREEDEWQNLLIVTEYDIFYLSSVIFCPRRLNYLSRATDLTNLSMKKMSVQKT